jgi:hypothetical protein
VSILSGPALVALKDLDTAAMRGRERAAKENMSEVVGYECPPTVLELNCVADAFAMYHAATTPAVAALLHAAPHCSHVAGECSVGSAKVYRIDVGWCGSGSWVEPSRHLPRHSSG